MALTRAELEATAKYFDCEDSERLVHESLSACLCAMAEEWEGDVPTVPLTVDCYVQNEWHEERQTDWAEWLVDQALDRYIDDDELAPEDGLELDIDSNAALLVAARAFITEFIKHAPARTCKRIGSFQITPEEFIEITKE